MKILLVYIPSRSQGVIIPYGLLAVASSIKEEGHDVRIMDLCLDNISDEQLMSEIEMYQPDVIGLGAITSGYSNFKRLSSLIKHQFPNIPLIAGGVIASISRFLITRANIDAVVLREGEIVIKNILKAVVKNQPFADIKGLACKGKDGSYNENPQEMPIKNLDGISIPGYSLIDVKRYCTLVQDYMSYFSVEEILPDSEISKIKSRSKYLIPIMSSRGCTHKCSFCYRHMKGIRQFSPQYVINQIKYIQKKYDIHFFQFVDELTNVTKKWCYGFCDLLESENMDITYVINGARATTWMNESMLRRFKETGCIKIGYGYESGSQKILEYIGKGVSKEMNHEVSRLMKKVGLHDSPQIVIGFPPESPETISETIEFLKPLLPMRPSVNYILPFPGTRDWDYCLKKGLIKDEEEFILNYDEAHKFRINLTEYPVKKVKNWAANIHSALDLAELKKNKKYFKYAVQRIGLKYLKNKISIFAESYRSLRYLKKIIKRIMVLRIH